MIDLAYECFIIFFGMTSILIDTYYITITATYKHSLEARLKIWIGPEWKIDIEARVIDDRMNFLVERSFYVKVRGSVTRPS